jgi:hypothetical protein
MLTFWKFKEVPVGLQFDHLPQKIGPVHRVADELLTIPAMRPFFSEKIMDGFVTLLWNQGSGTYLYLKDEIEFGGGVYSIQIQQRVSNRDFFRLYVQAYERLGVVLLKDKDFVDLKNFKKLS